MCRPKVIEHTPARSYRQNCVRARPTSCPSNAPVYPVIFITLLAKHRGRAGRLAWMLNVSQTSLWGHGSIVIGKHFSLFWWGAFTVKLLQSHHHHHHPTHTFHIQLPFLKALYSLFASLQQAGKVILCGGPTGSSGAKWHAAVVRGGSFNSTRTPNLPHRPFCKS